MKDVRPTTGKTLNALVSILGNVSGWKVLDAFCGTGKVAKTLRDRGAQVVTVEAIRERAVGIQKSLGNHDHLGLAMDVRRALKWLEKRSFCFDLIFADPPYGMNWSHDWPLLLENHSSLVKGLCVMERHRDDPIQLSDHWQLTDSRCYGISCLDFFVLKSEDQ